MFTPKGNSISIRYTISPFKMSIYEDLVTRPEEFYLATGCWLLFWTSIYKPLPDDEELVKLSLQYSKPAHQQSCPHPLKRGWTAGGKDL